MKNWYYRKKREIIHIKNIKDNKAACDIFDIISGSTHESRLVLAEQELKIRGWSSLPKREGNKFIRYYSNFLKTINSLRKQDGN